MPPRRLALLVATDRYQDTGLRQLAAPGNDTEALAEVLRDPAIADFDVTTLINEPNHVVGEAIGEFYHNRRRDDLTLLYFTGHGLKDDQGRLYLAMTNTKLDRLLFTGLSAQQIDEAMDSCSSRQKVLVLDCCYSGAFPSRGISKADSQVHTLEKFQGKGRVVLTASDATQYSFEGNYISGQGTRSVFTRFLVEGLATGDADLDGDGDISLDELYRYVYERVTDEMPQQRPKKQENVEGRIVIARNIHWSLPPSVRNAIESPFAPDRLAILEGLAHLHRVGNDLVRAEVINQTRRLIHDDSKAVSVAAMELITTLNPEQAQREADEPRWVPAVTSSPRRSAVEKQDEKQIKTSPSLSLSADDTTATNDQLERRASADRYTQTGTPAEKQASQRVRRETRGQHTTGRQVGIDLGLADSRGRGRLTRPQMILAASAALLAIFLIILTVASVTTNPVTTIPAGTDPGRPPSTTDMIVIKNFAFMPASLTVAPGTKITVINQDEAPHTVTANDKSFDTGTIAGGQRGEVTASTKPGNYPYICTIHQYMMGTLIVK